MQSVPFEVEINTGKGTVLAVKLVHLSRFVITRPVDSVIQYIWRRRRVSVWYNELARDITITEVPKRREKEMRFYHESNTVNKFYFV